MFSKAILVVTTVSFEFFSCRNTNADFELQMSKSDKKLYPIFGSLTFLLDFDPEGSTLKLEKYLNLLRWVK